MHTVYQRYKRPWKYCKDEAFSIISSALHITAKSYMTTKVQDYLRIYTFNAIHIYLGLTNTVLINRHRKKKKQLSPSKVSSVLEEVRRTLPVY